MRILKLHTKNSIQVCFGGPSTLGTFALTSLRLPLEVFFQSRDRPVSPGSPQASAKIA